MVNSQGGIRWDFTGSRYGLTVGESRNLRWRCRDANGTLISSFAGWAVSFYWTPLPLTALASATLTKSASLSSPPRAIVAILSTDWTGFGGALPATAGMYWYELWRTDVSSRLAYGRIEVIN